MSELDYNGERMGGGSVGEPPLCPTQGSWPAQSPWLLIFQHIPESLILMGNHPIFPKSVGWDFYHTLWLEYICSHKYLYPHTQAYIHTHILTHINIQICSHILTSVNKLTNTNKHTYTLLHIHVLTYWHLPRYTLTHTHTHGPDSTSELLFGIPDPGRDKESRLRPWGCQSHGASGSGGVGAQTQISAIKAHSHSFQLSSPGRGRQGSLLPAPSYLPFHSLLCPSLIPSLIPAHQQPPPFIKDPTSPPTQGCSWLQRQILRRG